MKKILFAVFLLAAPFGIAFAQTTPSLGIQGISSGSTVTPGTEVYFTLVASGLNNPTYSVTDSLSGSTISSSNINSSGGFVWIPTWADAGTHSLTFTATDASGASASATLSLYMQGPPTVTIASLAPGNTVGIGTTVAFTAVAANLSHPFYSVSDSVSGSSVGTTAINSSSGVFIWVPQVGDVGAHTITVTASDGSGHSATAAQTITVTPSASASISSFSPGTTTVFGSPVTLSVAATNFTNPIFALSDAFLGSTAPTSFNTATGVLTWTPLRQDVGTHLFTIQVSDSLGHTATLTQQITVQNDVLTIQNGPNGGLVTVGAPLQFTIVPGGFIAPISYQVGDSFSPSSITSANVSTTTGVFSWTPTAGQIGTHNVSIAVADFSGHSANTSVSFVVGANPSPLSTPVVGLPSVPQENPPPSPGMFTAYLSLGLTSDDVTALQQVLTKNGFYSGPVTGYFGNLTQAAVESFQTAHGLDAVGVVGPATRAALNQLVSSGAATAPTAASTMSPSAPTPSAATATMTTTATTTGDGYVFTIPLMPGASGQEVTELQQRLTDLGIYSGPITGFFGNLTEAAVSSFQGMHGITQAGYVGPVTRAALNAH